MYLTSYHQPSTLLTPSPRKKPTLQLGECESVITTQVIIMDTPRRRPQTLAHYCLKLDVARSLQLQRL